MKPRFPFFGSLAAGFNRLLQIQPGHFATPSGRRSGGTGSGAERARFREAARRRAEGERLKDAPQAEPTRQQRRAADRRAEKMPVGARQDLWHKLKGFSKVGRGRGE